MKKALFAVAVLVLAVSCGPKKTLEEKQADFDAQIEEIIKAMDPQMDPEEAEELAISNIVELGLNTIKKNPSDSLALYALESTYYYATPEQLQEALDALQKSFGETSIVMQLNELVKVKLGTKEGSQFVDFTVDHVLGLDEDGNEIIEKRSLSDFVGKGKYMLVDFWSPWCAPCKAEIPNIKSVYEKYHGDKFDILSVAVWEESRGMNWRNTVDTAAVYGVVWNQINNGHQEPAKLYGIEGIPHIILFGPDGTIVKRDLRGAALEAAVAAAVAE